MFTNIIGIGSVLRIGSCPKHRTHEPNFEISTDSFIHPPKNYQIGFAPANVVFRPRRGEVMVCRLRILRSKILIVPNKSLAAARTIFSVCRDKFDSATKSGCVLSSKIASCLCPTYYLIINGTALYALPSVIIPTKYIPAAKSLMSITSSKVLPFILWVLATKPYILVISTTQQSCFS